ncbi:MAG TPA: hypothetical protein PJ994_03080 [Tepidiformaceae bacterium]|nr:hypothetical protein [Tepidiformaceae bacterium]
MRPGMLFAALLVSLACASIARASIARADGEIGVVIQVGDQVETHCVAYTGTSINGEQALQAVGKTVEQYGGAGGRAVCAIDNVGCFDASSFDSCFCECKGRECTYWGFFTRKHGAGWVYSSLGFNLLASQDGDLHGWKWGVGGPASAPVPVDVTFEQVCGHPPRSTQPQATATTPRQPSPSPAPGSPTQAGPTQTTTTEPETTSTVAVSTPPNEASPTGSPGSTPPVIVTIGQTPEPPTTADPTGSSGSNAGFIAFGAISVVLVVAIAAAAIWRRGRGS